ncbi:hypothetical protein SEUCBS140593_010316 [Sporothrix eucalyptigena]|uniref:Major facilitator superfamily (MFS) profile domain-containing protein n=1 Tax=Sporothrix eucalyptigena TaxID=1812306 RepID=A0ABP0D103_9PEZI
MATDDKHPDSVTFHEDTSKAGMERGILVADMPELLRNLTPEELKKVGRRAVFKEDIIIMPCLMIMYILNYLDRNNISAAKLANITTELHLSSTQYQTCVSILFVGYILLQVPSNMILGKITRPLWYICGAMCVWGVVSATQSAVHSYAGLVVTRFFIGLVETVFYPGALFYLTMFYNRKQYALRASLLYCGAQLGNAFGNLLAIPILKLDGRYGITGWRWLFLIEGVVTVGISILFLFILPNNVDGIHALSGVEREWIHWNYKLDQGQDDDREEITPFKGLQMAVRDPKAWLLLSVMYATFTSAGVTNFFPSVVNSLGFSRTITYVLTAPPFLLCCVCMLANGFHSDRTGERFLHIVLPLVITLIANIIAISTLNIGARYTAMMLMPASFYLSSNVLLSWITGTLNQPVAKRAASIALINAVCNTPNIWTPYLYSGAPRYKLAFSVNLGTAALAIVVATLSYLYLKLQNAKLDKGEHTGRSGPTEAQIASGFRYQL